MALAVADSLDKILLGQYPVLQRCDYGSSPFLS